LNPIGQTCLCNQANNNGRIIGYQPRQKSPSGVAGKQNRLKEEMETTTNRILEESRTIEERNRIELSAAEEDANETDRVAEARKKEIEDLQAHLAAQMLRISYLENKSRKDEALRRQLHEDIQELRQHPRDL